MNPYLFFVDLVYSKGVKLKKIFNQIASMLQKKLTQSQRYCALAMSKLHVKPSVSERNVSTQGNKIVVVAKDGDIEQGH